MGDKSFHITGGRGLTWTLPNTHTVSIQFGSNNYSSNRSMIPCSGYAAFEVGERRFMNYDLAAGADGADEVETAVWDGNGDWVRPPWKNDDDVQGYMKTQDVLALVCWAASLPAVEKRKDKRDA